MVGDESRTLIRERAKELLESGQVQCVIGYENGSRGQVRPAFIREASDVDRLVWNRGCTHNLVTYLRDPKHVDGSGEKDYRVAILVKPCDSRALNILIAEKQIEREQIFAIGVVCSGVLEGAGFAGEPSDTLQARCLRCSDRVPVLSDLLVGEPVQSEANDDFVDVAELEGMSTAERAAFWLRQFERCILCYACRQVCPGCYCNICMFERDDSLWVGTAAGVKEKTFFHLGRAFHLATRCVDCDECQRVCPMELPLSLLNRKLGKEVQALFHYHPGGEADQSPLLTVLAEGEESTV
jgi:NAD-dependent dihydropyrimidine dehydrogenase PreA subunit